MIAFDQWPQIARVTAPEIEAAQVPILFQCSAKQFATRLTVIVLDTLVLRTSLGPHAYSLTLTHSRVAYPVRSHDKLRKSGSGSEQLGEGGTTVNGSFHLQISDGRQTRAGPRGGNHTITERIGRVIIEVSSKRPLLVWIGADQLCDQRRELSIIDQVETQTLQRAFAACGQQLNHEFLSRFGVEVDQRAGQMLCTAGTRHPVPHILNTCELNKRAIRQTRIGEVQTKHVRFLQL
jgi:hypothetical protein